MAGLSDASRRSELETETSMKTAITLEAAVAMIPDGATLMTHPAKKIIARRVAREIPPGGLVNLGIGLPTQVTGFLPPGINVFFQTENGLAGVGPRPAHGMENPNLVDAGGGFITAIPGAASFDSTFSFGLIRGGHLDLTVLGGLQVDAQGTPCQLDDPRKARAGHGRSHGPGHRGQARHRRHDPQRQGLPEDRRGMHVPAHLDSTGEPGRDRPGGHRADAGRARARERAPDVSVAEILAATGARLLVPESVPEMQLA